MKTKLFYFFLIVFIVGGCSQQKSSKIEGAWKLVYVIGIDGNKPYYSFPGTDTTEGQIKIWSKDQFSLVGILKYDTLHSDSFGAGAYKLTGNLLEETILYHSWKDFVGKTLKSTIEIKNDTLIQTILDENGKFNKSSYWLEKYVRF
jgi:hypothetical protein